LIRTVPYRCPSDRSSEYRISAPATWAAWINQGVPERNLAPRLEVQRLQNRVAAVHDDLPREVVRYDLARGLRVERLLRLSVQVDDQLLQNLSTDYT
jgi:hypothetical protein